MPATLVEKPKLEQNTNAGENEAHRHERDKNRWPTHTHSFFRQEDIGRLEVAVHHVGVFVQVHQPWESKHVGIWHMAFGVWTFGIWTFGIWTFGIWHLAFGHLAFGHLAFGIWHLDIWHLAFGILTFGIWHLAFGHFDIGSFDV